MNLFLVLIIVLLILILVPGAVMWALKATLILIAVVSMLGLLSVWLFDWMADKDREGRD